MNFWIRVDAITSGGEFKTAVAAVTPSDINSFTDEMGAVALEDVKYKIASEIDAVWINAEWIPEREANILKALINVEGEDRYTTQLPDNFPH